MKKIIVLILLMMIMSTNVLAKKRHKSRSEYLDRKYLYIHGDFYTTNEQF